MTKSEVAVVEGIDESYVEDALRLAYEAFAEKFRVGFRDADDLVHLFGDSVNTGHCFTAIADGRLLGILMFQTADREFFHPKLAAAFTRFSPVRALRIVLNLLLLTRTARPDEFIVDSLAVSPAARGSGIGTRLMDRAEDKARAMGKKTMSLDAIGENAGAIRLYERMGFKTIRVRRSRWLELAIRSKEVRRLEKPLTGGRCDRGRQPPPPKPPARRATTP